MSETDLSDDELALYLTGDNRLVDRMAAEIRRYRDAEQHRTTGAPTAAEPRRGRIVHLFPYSSRHRYRLEYDPAVDNAFVTLHEEEVLPEKLHDANARNIRWTRATTIVEPLLAWLLRHGPEVLAAMRRHAR